MATHTPGPWETGKGACHNIFANVGQPGTETLPERRCIARCDGAADSVQDFANAKLIANSPEMLTTLVEVEHWLGGIAYQGSTDLLLKVRTVLDRIEPCSRVRAGYIRTCDCTSHD